MTKPRQYVPGRTYKITRRTFDRYFYFAPTEVMEQCWRYIVALAISTTGVELHIALAMSNHWHALLTDTRGNLGEFLEIVHGYMARVANSINGRDGGVWDNKRTAVQWIPLADDVVSQGLYILKNPVKAELVHRTDSWPGFKIMPKLVGGTLTVDRPDLPFFRGGILPEQIEVPITAPPGWTDDDFATALAEGLDAYEHEMLKKNLDVPGATKVSRTSPLSKPTSEPANTRLNEVVCSDTNLYVHCLQQLAAFRKAYRVACRIFRRNKLKALFPYGTYELRRLYNVRVAAPPEPVPLR